MNIMFIILIITVSSLIVSFQVRVQLGQSRSSESCMARKALCNSKAVDDLGDQFRPAMRSGWLAYIKNVDGNAAPAATSCKVQGTLVVEDDDC